MQQLKEKGREGEGESWGLRVEKGRAGCSVVGSKGFKAARFLVGVGGCQWIGYDSIR